MTSAYFLCGLPGSGKTTRARELVREHDAVVFSEDVWIRDLYDPPAIHDDAARDRVKAVQLEIALDLLRRGIDVVFDWGVWARSERDHYRAVVAETSAEFVLIYLNVPLEELQRRVAARNVELPPDTFHIEPEQLAEWATWFEPPTADEHPLS